jgi:Zn2+/Cd2+-exporting ATPase
MNTSLAQPRSTQPPTQTLSSAQSMALTVLTLVFLLLGLFLPASLERWAYGLAYLTGGLPSAFQALQTLVRQGKLDVDALMVLAALGAWTVNQPLDGAILLTLFSLSNTLQSWAMGRTRAAIDGLKQLRPDQATLLEGTQEKTVALEVLRSGDIIRVRPGERFPADCTLERGETSADESNVTGESVPVDKVAGDALLSGTLNGEGTITARVMRPAGESTLERLIKRVEQARLEKGPTERFADRLEGPYTLAVLLSVPVVFGVGVLLGLEYASAWYRAMTFLVVASPCAVVISTPAATLSAMAASARQGVLFKGGAALEALSQVKTVAMDKTGTLTEGKMRLVELHPFKDESGMGRVGDVSKLLRLAAALEWYSEHPVAKAVRAAVSSHNLPALSHVQAPRGYGIAGTLGESDLGGLDLTPSNPVRPNPVRLWAGNRRMAEREGAALSEDVLGTLEGYEIQGYTPILLGQGSHILAALAVADTPRAEAKEALAELRDLHLEIAMLTGDRRAPAEQVALELGVTRVEAELLPEDKLEALARLRKLGAVAMVGDGVNDAAALAKAEVGIALGSGSDAALESADVVLMNGDLRKLPGAIRLAHATQRAVRFNLSIAFGVIGIVGAMALFGAVSLPVGVIAHEGGTVFVVLSGLRLLTFPLER